MVQAYEFDENTTRKVVRQVGRAEVLPQNKEPVYFNAAAKDPVPRHAKITAVTAINGGIRFRYTIELGFWNMASSPSTGGTWVKTSGSQTLYAFSAAEDMNTFTSGTGTIGTGNTGVAETDGTIGTSTCKLKALPVGGYVVVLHRGYDPAAGQLYYTIDNFSNSSQ